MRFYNNYICAVLLALVCIGTAHSAQEEVEYKRVTSNKDIDAVCVFLQRIDHEAKAYASAEYVSGISKSLKQICTELKYYKNYICIAAYVKGSIAGAIIFKDKLLDSISEPDAATGEVHWLRQRSPYVSELAVDEKFRHYGIGRTLLSIVPSYYPSDSIIALDTHKDNPAYDFYTKKLQLLPLKGKTFGHEGGNRRLLWDKQHFDPISQPTTDNINKHARKKKEWYACTGALSLASALTAYWGSKKEDSSERIQLLGSSILLGVTAVLGISQCVTNYAWNSFFSQKIIPKVSPVK